MASACRRKRSGAASQTLARSKKSKVRTRLGERLHGLRASAARRRRRRCRRAPRRGRATLVGEPQHGDDERDVGLDGRDDVGGGDVVARPTSAQQRGCATRPAPGTPRAPRRPPSGAGRGPRLWRCAVAGVAAAGRRARSRARSSARQRPIRRHRRCVPRSASWPLPASLPTYRHRRSRRLSARSGSGSSAPVRVRAPSRAQTARASAASIRAQRLLAPEQRDALEDPRRDRRAGDRHAHRLVDLARLDAAALDDLAERRLDRSARRTARARRERRARLRRAPRGPARPASARAPPGRRPGRRTGSPPAARSRRASGSSPG